MTTTNDDIVKKIALTINQFGKAVVSFDADSSTMTVKGMEQELKDLHLKLMVADQLKQEMELEIVGLRTQVRTANQTQCTCPKPISQGG